MREILERHKSVKVVVGSDGSHSVVRSQVFQEAKVKCYEALQYIVDVKYSVQGPGRSLSLSLVSSPFAVTPLRKVDQALPTLRLMDFVAQEHISQTENNITHVTLRLVTKEETFAPMRNATFKEPFNMATHKDVIPESLYRAIKIWLNAKTLLTK